MAHLLPSPKMQFFDINGDPLSGGKVHTYEATTSTRKATYTTAAAAVANANPVILDSRGEANIFWSTGSYKIVLTDSDDAEIYTVDSITLSATGEAGSSFRVGSGAPSNGLGQDGDRYLRTDTGQVYLKDENVYSVESTMALPASTITNTPSGNLAAVTVQNALNELQTELDTATAHIADGTDAHAASAITNTPSGNLAATNVQTALNELQTDVDTRIKASTGNTFDDGTVGAPSIGFASDPDSGLYKTAANGVGVSTGGYLGLEVKKSTGNYGNVGMGSTPSASDNYPLLISRTNASGGTSVQVANPSTAANSKGSIQVSTDSGNVQGEISAYPAASTVFAYISALVLRCTDSAVKTVIGATQYISFHTNNTLTAAGEALRINADYSLSFMQQISTPATPASGTLKVYQKSDNKLYILNSAGGELEIGSGGGGGGSGIVWDESANAPVKSLASTGFSLYSFEAGYSQELYTEIHVPSTYVAGDPIALKIKAYSISTSGNFLLTAQATLIRAENDDIASTTNQRTTTNSAIAMSSSNDSEIQKISLDITDSSGQINGVAVAASDTILVRLYRNTDTDTGAVLLLHKQTEVTFT
jgi:hypothetical protein